jgi:hypothetical protein
VAYSKVQHSVAWACRAMGPGRVVGWTNWLCERSTRLALEDLTTSLTSTLSQKRNISEHFTLHVYFELITFAFPFLSSWARKNG